MYQYFQIIKNNQKNYNNNLLYMEIKTKIYIFLKQKETQIIINNKNN